MLTSGGVDMSPLRIGVLGGAGFIGRRLAPRLAGLGHSVLVGDVAEARVEGARFQPCDVADPKAVRAFVDGLDVVYNLAAEHRDDVRPLERYTVVNVDGARNLCAAAADAGIQRIVFTSSVAVYGLPTAPVSEDSPPSPFNEYGRTKLLAEGVYREWAAADSSRSLVIVRPTVVFGEGNRGNVYNLARQVASGRFLMIGDGKNRKSMAYVENVAGFLVHCLHLLRPGVEVFNYADSPDFDMNELIALMRTHFGRAKGVGPRIPYSLGMFLGHLLDVVARVSRRDLPISAVRIRKFCASTQVRSDKAFGSGFAPEFAVGDAVRRFLAGEFPAR